MSKLEQYTQLLYDHRFDVDDIIRALCGSNHHGRWLLETRTGALTAEDPQKPLPHTDGDDMGHWHEIAPLPASFITEIAEHEKKRQLSADDQARLDTILRRAQNVHDLPPYFEDDRVGGWLRERIKEAALEWLDMKDMIPPSMRHVYDAQAADSRMAPQGPAKVTINLDGDLS